MGKYIVKMADEQNRDWFFEYSSIVDSPVTSAMTRDEFKAYYRDEYGRSSMGFDFEQRMKRVDAKGTSAHHYDSAEETIGVCNRAGKGETWLTPAQTLELVIGLRTDSDFEIEGVDHDFMCCRCGKPIDAEADRVWRTEDEYDPLHRACVEGGD